MDARAQWEPGDAIFSITGVFNAFVALRFGQQLAELPPEASVVLDFSHAREVSDLALGVLATTVVAAPHPRIVLRGLTQHHERMLQYLGVRTRVLDRREADVRPAAAVAKH